GRAAPIRVAAAIRAVRLGPADGTRRARRAAKRRPRTARAAWAAWAQRGVDPRAWEAQAQEEQARALAIRARAAARRVTRSEGRRAGEAALAVTSPASTASAALLFAASPPIWTPAPASATRRRPASKTTRPGRAGASRAPRTRSGGSTARVTQGC